MHRGDYWRAAAITFAFMLVCVFTPVGPAIGVVLGWLDARLLDWSWHISGLAVFWIAYLFLRLRRSRSRAPQN